jgi:molybdate transport system substrate-binding protein
MKKKPAFPLAAPLVAMLAALSGFAATPARAADISVFATIAFQHVFDAAIPAFDRSSGNMVHVEYGGGSAMADRVKNGGAADVYVGSRAGVDALLAAGKVRPDSVVDLARSPVGFGVKKGAPKPDVSTAAALRRTLLAAHGITYPDPASGSPSANHLVRIAAQLGIADELQARTRRPAGGAAEGPVLLGTGEADLAFQQNCELLLAPDVELLGPLPPEFELITIMTAAVPANAHEPAAGLAFIRSLKTAPGGALMKRWGLEPITP